jgi:hypothetical protein
MNPAITRRTPPRKEMITQKMDRISNNPINEELSMK